MLDKVLHWILVILGVVIGAEVFGFICAVLEKLVQGRQVDHSAGQAARVLLDRLGITEVAVVETEQAKSDTFDAESGQVQLKPSIYRAKRTGGLAIAAHEVGHVVHAVRYSRLLAWKQRLARQAGKVIILTGLVLVAARLLNLPILFALGDVCYVVMVFLVSLKWIEEIDASRRGIRLLTEANLLPPSGRRDAVIKLSLAFGTYLGLTLPFPILLAFLIKV